MTRPQLTQEQAAMFRRDNVLRYAGPAGADRVDPWVPKPIDTAGLRPDYLVGQGAQFGTVIKAINHAVENHKSGRIVIGIEPGRHEGLVYLPRTPLQFTLVGLGTRPSDVTLFASIDAEMTGAEYAAQFGSQFFDAPHAVKSMFCKIAARDPITTANASVIRAESDGFNLANLTVQNTYQCDRDQAQSDEKNAEGQYRTGQHQAVALLIAGADRVQVEDVTLKSFQDTLYLQSPTKGETVRSCFTACDIEGDVDFIFGQSTAWFEDCTIRSLGSRAPQAWATAPSTDIRSRYGFVFDNCRFTHDDAAAERGRFYLGRQWFEGVRATPFGTPDIDGYQLVLGPTSGFDGRHGTISQSTLDSVGKCVIMRSKIGPHIRRDAPWDEWSGNIWNPRHRPVLLTAADMLRPLAAWLSEQGLDYSDIDSAMPFLAEFENETIGDEI